jgi:regulator of protease activity HflC (stomatin/prohibitin superfamily)
LQKERDSFVVAKMGANRKLQQEIDRTLKKVAEGIEVFDQIWEKVRPPTSLQNAPGMTWAL